MDEEFITDDQGNLDIAYYMAQSAEMALSLPYSLMLDAWDKLDIEGVPGGTREMFQTCLRRAIETYLASPTSYTFHPMSDADY